MRPVLRAAMNFHASKSFVQLLKRTFALEKPMMFHQRITFSPFPRI